MPSYNLTNMQARILTTWLFEPNGYLDFAIRSSDGQTAREALVADGGLDVSQWIRDNPQLSMILVNPENPYHWMSMKVTVVNEVAEDGPDGARVTAQLNKIWRKYIGEGDTYQLRDPSIDEKRVLFECRIDRIATFGKP